MRWLHTSELYSLSVVAPGSIEDGNAYGRRVLIAVYNVFVSIESEAQEMEEEGGVDASFHPRLL